MKIILTRELLDRHLAADAYYRKIGWCPLISRSDADDLARRFELEGSDLARVGCKRSDTVRHNESVFQRFPFARNVIEFTGPRVCIAGRALTNIVSLTHVDLYFIDQTPTEIEQLLRDIIEEFDDFDVHAVIRTKDLTVMKPGGDGDPFIFQRYVFHHGRSFASVQELALSFDIQCEAMVLCSDFKTYMTPLAALCRAVRANVFDPKRGERDYEARLFQQTNDWYNLLIPQISRKMLVLRLMKEEVWLSPSLVVERGSSHYLQYRGEHILGAYHGHEDPIGVTNAYFTLMRRPDLLMRRFDSVTDELTLPFDGLIDASIHMYSKWFSLAELEEIESHVSESTMRFRTEHVPHIIESVNQRILHPLPPDEPLPLHLFYQRGLAIRRIGIPDEVIFLVHKAVEMHVGRCRDVVRIICQHLVPANAHQLYETMTPTKPKRKVKKGKPKHKSFRPADFKGEEAEAETEEELLEYAQDALIVQRGPGNMFE